jgi:hypothetical protein
MFANAASTEASSRGRALTSPSSNSTFEIPISPRFSAMLGEGSEVEVALL